MFKAAGVGCGVRVPTQLLLPPVPRERKPGLQSAPDWQPPGISAPCRCASLWGAAQGLRRVCNRSWVQRVSPREREKSALPGRVTQKVTLLARHISTVPTHGGRRLAAEWREQGSSPPRTGRSMKGPQGGPQAGSGGALLWSTLHPHPCDSCEGSRALGNLLPRPAAAHAPAH